MLETRAESIQEPDVNSLYIHQLVASLGSFLGSPGPALSRRCHYHRWKRPFQRRVRNPSVVLKVSRVCGLRPSHK